MMDILTVLLLFLLKSFVVDGEAMIPPAGIQLPQSTAEGLPDESLVVAIDGEAVLLGDEVVARISEPELSGELVLPSLAEKLEAVWRQREEIARRKHGNAAMTTVTIQGDQHVEYRVLERVMVTLNESGFEDISLAVIKDS